MADTIKISNNQDNVFIEVDGIPIGWSNDGIFYKTVGGKYYKIANNGNIRALNAGVLADGTDQTSRINTILGNSRVHELIFDAYNGSINIAGAVTVPSEKKLVFKNGCKLIGTGSVSGGIIECDDLKQCFGGSVVVTNLLNKIVSVRWWGAYPQAHYDTGLGVDNLPFFNAALASQKGDSRIYVPGSDDVSSYQLGHFYYCSDTIEIAQQVEFFGDGRYKSILYIPSNLGLWLNWGSSNSHVFDIGLVGNYGQASAGFNSSTQHGLLVNSNNNVIERIYSAYFSGDGINVAGEVGGTPYTNANNNKIKNCDIIGNGRHGIILEGGDGNNCTVEAVDATSNAQINIYDHSFLGNFFYACHTASAAINHPLQQSCVYHGGLVYLCIYTHTNIEPGVASNWQDYWNQLSISPPFYLSWNSATTYYRTAGYCADDANQAGLFSGCYGEGDQNPFINTGNSRIDAGFASAYGSLPGAIGMRQGILTSQNYQVYDFVSNRSVKLSLRSGYPVLGFYDNVSQPFGFLGNVPSGVIQSDWGNGAGGSASVLFVAPSFADWATYMGRDRGVQGNRCNIIQYFGTPIGHFSNYAIHRLVAFGSAAPTTGDFGVGDIVLNLDPTSSTLFWQCSVASVAGNGGTWIARTGGGGGSSSLTQYQIGVGDASNLLSGSADLTFDGSVLDVNAGMTVSNDSVFSGKVDIGTNVVAGFSLGVAQSLAVGTSYEMVFAPSFSASGDLPAGSIMTSHSGINLVFAPEFGGGTIAAGKLVFGNYNGTFNSLVEMANGSNVLLLAKSSGMKVKIGNTPDTYSTGGRKMLVRNDTTGNVEVETVPSGSSGVDTLNVQYTDVSNSGTSETDLMSYTLPANQLLNVGDRVVVEAHFSTAANANTKTLKFYFGTYSHTQDNSTIASGANILMRFTIIKTGSNTQKITREYNTGFSSNVGNTTGTIVDTTTEVIKFTGQSGTASNDITQNTMTVTYYPI